MTAPRARGAPAGAGARRAAWAAVAAVTVLGGCGTLSRPQSQASGHEGTVRYVVGQLSFEAPAAWQASGDAHHVLLVGPGGEGRIDVREIDRRFRDDAQCLADAEAALQRGASRLTAVRRHPTSVAGRRAVFQEADQDRWHGWAWGVCNGTAQYRLSVNAPAPAGEPAVRAMRLVASSATFLPR